MGIATSILFRAAGKRRERVPERTTITPTVVGILALVAAAIISWESHEQAMRWARRVGAQIQSRVVRGGQTTPDPQPVGARKSAE